MGSKFSELSRQHKDFIAEQHMFFVATAATDGRINVSPKGLDSLRVLSSTSVVWMNLTGSGNETAAHLLAADRMTLMFCSFQGAPTILRLYGRGELVHPGDGEWQSLAATMPAFEGARQLIKMRVELVHTSCGFGVPLYEFTGQRRELPDWLQRKGEAGIRDYWQQRNSESLDGRPTDMAGPDAQASPTEPGITE